MRKLISSILAASVAAGMGVSVFAAVPEAGTVISSTGLTAPAQVVDGDNVSYADKGVTVTLANGSIQMDTVLPNSTIYIPIDEAMMTWTDSAGKTHNISGADLVNSKLFTFKADKKTNSKLVESIELVEEKRVGDSDHTNWIKVKVKDSTTTTDQKFEAEITFKAKKDSLADGSSNNYLDGSQVKSGDTVTLDLTLWINNNVVGNDDNPDTGDRVVMDPESNETNSLIWGDDRAAIKFEANDDASKFYARLSTKSDTEIYATYADPIGADLWFYDFVGNPSIPSTSRATLTLGVPWDEDDDYAPNPENVYIYQLDASGYLTDVTSQFTYSEDETDIAGWSTKTRVLGTYIVSDMELDVEAEEEDGPISSSKPDTDKEIPSTGASDMINAAVTAALASLALGAGAVVAKKRK